MIPQKGLQARSSTVLSSLLKRMPENLRSSYIKFLPELIAIEVSLEKNHNPPLVDLSLKEILGQIDDSWYIETFSKFSKSDLLFYLSLFPEKKRASLAERFAIQPPFYLFSEKLELYALNLLFGELFPDDPPLPLSYLPDSPLAFLCTASGEKLHKLSFYLGLFDISLELKSVINGSILKHIEKTLFPDEINFCREISEFRHPLSLGQMGLTGWNEDSDLLRKVIFERGLYRLSIALSEASPDLIWYVIHLLNKESTLKLEKLPKTSIDAKAINIVLEQTLFAWKGLCTVLD